MPPRQAFAAQVMAQSLPNSIKQQTFFGYRPFYFLVTSIEEFYLHQSPFDTPRVTALGKGCPMQGFDVTHHRRA